MHEAIFSRRDVQGSSDQLRLAIHSPFNCVAVHDACHDQGDRVTKEACVGMLIRIHGRDALVGWVESISTQFKSGLGREMAAYVSNCP